LKPQYIKPSVHVFALAKGMALASARATVVILTIFVFRGKDENGVGVW